MRQGTAKDDPVGGYWVFVLALRRRRQKEDERHDESAVLGSSERYSLF
jgi:hypothetical protein